MNIQHIQNKLSEKYLNIFQYFGYSFITFKELIFDSNNMWWIFFFFAFNLMDSAITIFYYLFLFLFFKKIIYKIEDNYRLNLGASAQKFFFLYAIYFILNFASSFLFPSLLWFLPPEIIFLAIYSVIFVIWYKLLYFIPLFMARPFNLEESWNYNLHLSKGNKLRIIIPSIIFLGLIFLIYFPLGINIFLFRGSSFSDYLIFTLISSFIHTFLIIMFIIMNCIIYLNVEYMDRKIK